MYALRILPPWYRTWWAWTLWILGGAGVLGGLIQLYTYKLRRQKVLLERLVAKRTQQLKEATLTDPLTGLRNRRFITEILQNDVSAFVGFKHHVLEARKRGQLGDVVFGLFMLDMDHFKTVNDTYGHDAGDQVLKQFAEILKASVRQDDAVMRVGGEEFLVVLKKTLPEYLPEYAAKLLKTVAETPFDLGDGLRIHKTCSIGYTRFPLYAEHPDLLSFEQTLMVADLGLYYAKHHGRNRAVPLEEGTHVPEHDEAVRKAVTSLDEALARGHLRLVASPEGT